MMFKYRKHLESRIEELKAENKILQDRNWELTKSLSPILRRGDDKTSISHSLEPKASHVITRDEKNAQCLCGWKVTSDDPGKLQIEISNHYRSFVVPIRRSWPAAKSKIENQSNKEANA